MNVRFLIIFSLVIASIVVLWRTCTNQKPQMNGDETLIVGTNAEFPPFSLYKERKITGFDIEIINEIGRRLGKKVIIKDLPFDALIPEIQLNKIHVIAGGLNPTPERAQQVLFTQPLFEGDQLVIFSLKSNPIHSVQELKNKRVIVNEGYFADAFLSQKKLSITLIRLSTTVTIEGLMALANKKGDAFVASAATVIPFMNDEQKQKFFISKIEDAQEKDAFAVAKALPDLHTKIDQVIAQMKADGTLDSFIKEWFGS
jgi:ABC-type amino acid transport substrate-binding protein